MLDELRSVYTPEGCGVWLYSPHKLWGGLSAVDLMDQGRMDDVLAAIEQLATGSFA